MVSTISEAKKYMDDEVFNELRTNYHKYYAKLVSHLPPQEPKSKEEFNVTVSPHQCNHSELKLPKVELPTFKCAYEDWMESVVKLQRLKSALSGEAELVINLELSDANLFVAKNLLSTRYHHTRRLVNSYFKKLYELSPIKVESSKALKFMLNTLNDCCSALKQSNVNIEDYQLIFHMCRKLPQSFLSAWEESQGSSNAIPTYEKFSSFLETRFRMLEMIEHVEKSNKSFQTNSQFKSNPKKKLDNKKTNPKQTSNKGCIVCKANHKLGQCENFLKLSQSDKFQIVKSNQSCINCLDSTHTAQT